MNLLLLGSRTSFGLLAVLLSLAGFVACSEHDSNGSANNAGAAQGGTTGTSGGAFAGNAAGLGGASSSGGSSGAAAMVSASGHGGLTGNAGALGSGAGGVPAAGFGGSAGRPAAGSAGTVSASAGRGNAGSSGSLGAGGSSAAFTQVATMLGKNCGIAGCHADKQSPHFTPGPQLYETLTGPNTVLAACDYTKMVEAGDPANSALVRLMNRKCGSFTMPPSCKKTPCLSETDLKTLSDWIQAGAPP